MYRNDEPFITTRHQRWKRPVARGLRMADITLLLRLRFSSSAAPNAYIFDWACLRLTSRMTLYEVLDRHLLGFILSAVVISCCQCGKFACIASCNNLEETTCCVCIQAKRKIDIFSGFNKLITFYRKS